ncbi:MAG: DUF1015 domain-containing protein [Oscillospiraceae bacterium]|nr:DUF1015 domain-containing protein [Oscillospiraceae bacterium]
MSVFQAADIFLPPESSLPDWAVIACDQFTSQPEYWQQVRQRVADRPSAYHIIFPEAELGGDDAGRIAAIDATMDTYRRSDLFRRFPQSYVYIERTLLDGSIRRGVLGAVDLETYDFHADAISPIRATEQTVVERIPPRVKIRTGASLELSHVLLLCDDAQQRLLETLEARKAELEKLYDFDLMQGGGHIAGWLCTDEASAAFDTALACYEREMTARYTALGKAPLLYAVGDGNHSLATAKTCWEALKAQDPALAGSDHPARYAMVELENIHDAAQKFEPIHRIVRGINVDDFLAAAEELCAPKGYEVRWFAGERQGVLRLDPARGELAIAILQPFLDAYLKTHGGSIDYIHGDDVVRALAQESASVGLLLPGIAKGDFFRGIALDGVLPRKTFSMGHAREKRYYLECRAIRAE